MAIAAVGAGVMAGAEVTVVGGATAAASVGEAALAVQAVARDEAMATEVVVVRLGRRTCPTHLRLVRVPRDRRTRLRLLPRPLRPHVMRASARTKHTYTHTHT